jgi:DNA-binding beta-propeller fold protein YncE
LIDGLDALSLAAELGAVWVGGRSGTTKIDTVTGQKLGTAPGPSQAPGEAASVALGGNAAWFATSSSQTLSKLDPQSLAIKQTFTVGHGPSDVAVGEGAAWVANSRDGTISRVDLRGSRSTTIRVGQAPGGVIVAYGAIWTSPGDPRS